MPQLLVTLTVFHLPNTCSCTAASLYRLLDIIRYCYCCTAIILD